jgi:serine/threonine protein kinase/Tfp pilus assembly protein PilF
MTQPGSSHGSTLSKLAQRDDATRAVHKRPRAGSGSRSGPSTPADASGASGPGDRRPAAVGDQLFGFRLHHELGHGAFARVFLATQADLAGRPVVVKISGIAGDEPQTLAQLQHTHIVPIHSVHEDKSKGLRAVCMPYFGGASLAAVLQALRKETRRPIRGEQLAQALRQVSGPTSVGSTNPPETPDLAASAGQNSPLSHWAPLNYVQAAAWLVARLAEGLQHAHQRGVLHRDVKPSNILLCADGQPMLLDFNVSQKETADPDTDGVVLGGTVAYMSPEHLSALGSQDAALIRRVDRTADVYSLGLVLYEMLTGDNPFQQASTYSPRQTRVEALAEERRRTTPSARRKRADVPWSLEGMVRHCLAPDPAERYQQAEHLAEDLRRFLEDRPLRHASELSRIERVRKWMRRHPRLTSSGSVAGAAAVLLVAAGLALVAVRDHLRDTSEQLQAVQAQDRKRRFEEGHNRALCLVNTTIDLPEQLHAVRENHLREGRTVCVEALSLYGVLDREDWQEDPQWQALPADERRRLGEDVRELLVLLARARACTTPEAPEVLREALALLRRGEAIQELAPCRALWEDRARYFSRLGDQTEATASQDRAQAIQPATARDYYLLAGSFARGGQYARALEELDRALRESPRHYWSAVQRGICHQELGQFALAAADFGVCIGLWPEFAWGYFNRGYALEKSGHLRDALQDYSAALERDPGFLLAYLNRGMVRLELKQFAAALEDFRTAADRGEDGAVVHAGKGIALEALGRHAEADAAFREAFARPAPEAVRTRISWIYGFTGSGRLPEKALKAFDEVLQRQPRHPQALYGRAMILAGRGQEQEAIGLFAQAIQADPGLVEARRFRAILLARAGNFTEASQDINWCLEREPQGGATHYAAACVAALAAEKYPDRTAARQAAEQALTFLHQAFTHGYGMDRAPADPDLSAIRSLPRFDQLLRDDSALSRRSTSK